MFSSFVITLREGIEGALAIAIIYLYLRKTGKQHLLPAVWWGLLIALAGSIAGAFLLERISINNEILEGVLMFVAAFFVGTMILWMWRSAKGLKREIEAKIEQISAPEQHHRAAWVGLFFFTFLMIFREGIETVIFLSAVNFTTDALLSFLGGITGLLIAVLFGVFFVRGSIRIDLGRFFKITGIVLLLFVVQLLISGIHELSEGGVIDIGQQGMALVGPFVKNNALFLVGILLIPFLMLMIPAKKPVAQAAAHSSAEKRLLLAEQKRQRVWRTSAAVLSLFIVLFIAYDFVYGQNKRKLSPPVEITAIDGAVRIPVNSLETGKLYRYVLSGTPVRFILMKDEKGMVATAFDACEICGSQGYVQESGSVICLNCAADINPATLGAGGGCNPIALKSTVQDGFVIVQLRQIDEGKQYF